MIDTRNTDTPSESEEPSAQRPSKARLEDGSLNRREFLTDLSSSAIAISALGLVSPAGLAAANGRRSKRLRVFSKSEAATYAAWGEVLAIGAAKAGVAQFVDKYLAKPYPNSLLLLRLLQNPPFDKFYIDGIAAINQESEARFSHPFLALTAEQRNVVVNAAATSTTIAWTTPPPNFFYFVSRSDAVDVVYGTVNGFHKLNIPYLPHIPPRRPW